MLSQSTSWNHFCRLTSIEFSQWPSQLSLSQSKCAASISPCQSYAWWGYHWQCSWETSGCQHGPPAQQTELAERCCNVLDLLLGFGVKVSQRQLKIWKSWFEKPDPNHLRRKSFLKLTWGADIYNRIKTQLPDQNNNNKINKKPSKLNFKNKKIFLLSISFL